MKNETEEEGGRACRYNHLFSIGFSCVTNHKTGEDVTPLELREAILHMLSDLPDSEMLEACGPPCDSYELHGTEIEWLP